MKKLLIVMLVLIMSVALVACGGDKPAPETGGSDVSSGEAGGEASGGTTEAADLSNPEIVVELNDHEALLELTKKMQNFEVKEGTVIQVTGTVSRNTSTPSLMAEVGDGAKIGISVFIDDAPDDKTPAEGAVVTAIGVAKQGEYFMEFHALMENVN